LESLLSHPLEEKNNFFTKKLFTNEQMNKIAVLSLQVNIYWVKDTMRLQPNPRYNVMPTGKMRGETEVGEIKKNTFFSFFSSF
jgi:hypothetical protein